MHAKQTKIREKLVIWLFMFVFVMVPCTTGAVTNTGTALTASFVRNASTSADVYVHATYAEPSKIVSAVTREVYDEDEDDFVTDSRTYKKTVYYATSITHMLTLPIVEDKEYRIKVEITDTYDDIETTVTTYVDLVDPAEDECILAEE